MKETTTTVRHPERKRIHLILAAAFAIAAVPLALIPIWDLLGTAFGITALVFAIKALRRGGTRWLAWSALLVAAAAIIYPAVVLATSLANGTA
jgi:cell division protein FtsW (lipid II flippase)